MINYIIDVEYREKHDSLINYENLLDLHLSFRNNEIIKLQYHSIGIDSDRFLPFEYSIGGLREFVSNIQLKDSNIDDWIKIWHAYFIINLYFNYVVKTNVGKDNKYHKEIKKMLDELDKKSQMLKCNIDWSKKEVDELCSQIKQIKAYYEGIYKSLFEEFTPRPQQLKGWDNLWKKLKAPCIRVAKAVSYTSYFELAEHGYFVKHKLIPDRVWTKLHDVGISNNKIERLKDIETLLYPWC